MQKTTSSNSGIYILEIYACEEFQIHVKKFKDISIPKGYHYYIGSAQKNLSQRIERHFRKEKKIHWHIDHLTSDENIKLANAYVIYDAPKNMEEEIANDFPDNFKSKILLKGFGNSDTKGTITHLFYNRKKIPYNHFSARYQSIVRFKLSSNE